MESVKCQDCAYLCVRDITTGILIAPPDKMREKGVRLDPKFDHAPRCLMGVASPTTEYDALEGTGRAKEDRFLEVIVSPRVCDKFVPPMAGLSPQEVRDRVVELATTQGQQMHDLALLKLQFELAERASDKQRQWQEAQDDKRQKWENKRDGEKRRDDKLKFWWEITKAVGGGAIMIACSVIAFFAARHYAEQDRIAAEQRAVEKASK